MRKLALILALAALLVPGLTLAETSKEPAPQTPDLSLEDKTIPTVEASSLLTSSSQLSDALAEILQTPARRNMSTPTCYAQVRCPNGLYLGCNGYTGPDACESVRYCVVCDGYIYDCPNAFCPH